MQQIKYSVRARHVVSAVIAAGVVALALAGCAEPYEERMTFLDDMSSKGIAYRKDLQKQGTAPSETACGDGYDLLQPAIPFDAPSGASPKWQDQVKEAYLKACMTGQPRPKPEPSGIKAVTPVPHGSETPLVPLTDPATPPQKE